MRVLPLLGCLALVSACTSTVTQANDVPTDPIEPPVWAWLDGCWLSEEGTLIENWTLLEDNTLLGKGWNPKPGGEFAALETMTITAKEEPASAVFTARLPSGAETEFTSSAMVPGLMIFENAEHDYPQVITYLLEEGRLFTSISKTDGSDQQNWVYVPCNDGVEERLPTGK